MSGTEVTYRLVRSRRRSISITVSPSDGVIVRAPLRTPESEIRNFVTSKNGWITKHLANQKELIRINVSGFSDGDILPLAGKDLRIVFSASPKIQTFLNGEEIVFGTPWPANSSKMNAVVRKWLLNYSAGYFKSRVNELTGSLGITDLKPSEIKTRFMRSRWGSCSVKGVVTLNATLMLLPVKYSDYVILHELCHLRYHNHGINYHRLLGSLYPEYKSVRKELRRYRLS